MFLNRRNRTMETRLTQRERPRSAKAKIPLVLALAALFSLIPLPGVDFVPVASATERSFSTLSQSSSSPDTASTDRIVRGEQATEPFTLIALTYDVQPVGPVLVRVSRDGVWGEWTELDLEGSSGPDENTDEALRAEARSKPGFASEPYFVGNGTGYEISLERVDEPSAHVAIVRESLGRVAAEATPVAGAALPRIAGMQSRAAWGARDAKSAPNVASTVEMAVVHHSDSPNSYSPAQVPSVLRGVQAFHMDGRGWDDIGYNFVVDKYGGIWEGRGGGVDKAVVGAHATGFNTGTVGVMVLGTYTATAPTSASVESVAHVIGWKMAINGTNPAGSVNFTSGGGPKYPAGQVINLPRVVGHGDVGQTSCPGLVRNSLRTIQNRAIDYYAWYHNLVSPEGAFESASGGTGTVAMTGWASDPGAAGAAWVRVSAGPVSGSFYTGIARPDIASAHSVGPNTGWSGTLKNVPPGMQPACALIQGAGGTEASLGCKWVLVADPTGKSPVGRFDYAVTTPGEVHVRGWALDPDSPSTVKTDVLIDGQVRWTSYADQASTTIPWSYRATMGVNRQFQARVPAVTGGPHNVCVRATNYKDGVNTLVDCQLVDVPAHVPSGVIETIGTSDRSRLDLTGWALDLESTKPVDLRVVVGARSYLVTADRPRSDIAAKYPGYGDRHGFATTVYADGGKQSYCVYALNIGGGSDGLLGCGTANIVK